MTGTPNPCPGREEILRLLRLRDEDLLAPGEAGRLSAHLSGCAACRDEALRFDPSILFLPLSLSGAPSRPGAAGAAADGADEGRRLADRVRASLDLDRARRRVAPRARIGAWGIGRGGPGWAAWKWSALAKVAAAAFAGIALVVATVQLSTPPRKAGNSDSPLPGVLSGSDDSYVSYVSATSSASSISGTRGEGAAGAPPIEVVASPGAKVYQFAPASRHEPTVVFVVDRDTDL